MDKPIHKAVRVQRRENFQPLAQRKVLTRGQFFSLHTEVDAIHRQRLRIHLAVVQRDGLELFFEYGGNIHHGIGLAAARPVTAWSRWLS